MNNYDFLNLSSGEFEHLVRDLLQNHFNLFLESFTTGRDSGIDLRYSAIKNTGIIIQCKRYQNFGQLYGKLQKEVDKVTLLNPSRYILATSVPLTPNQKEKIISLFSPHIETPSDIFGRDDLNNILGQNEAIEKKHYKLWLSSTAILEKIVSSKIYNLAHFEEDQIKDVIKLYVQNDSYPEALEILKKFHYLIISGIPGIGKTTLARILVYYLLSEDFEEFIFLSDSISDGIEMYKEGKKQVFLFDDFLGKNFLDIKPNINEESRLLKFIEKVKKSNDKALILTTREYILSQAKSTYELFNGKELEIAKCVLDLSKYTKLVKAQILYNHLYFSEIPQEALFNLVETGIYLQLIGHKNYSPRIIETVIKNKAWEDISPEEFPELFKTFFDNPESVWLHAYENQITELSKVTLAIIYTLGTPIYLNDVADSTSQFSIKMSVKYNLNYSSNSFKKTLKELENSFIGISKDSSDNLIVEYQNPSIQDFLTNYLGAQIDLISDIIRSASYISQILNLFTPSSFNSTSFRLLGSEYKIFNDPMLKSLMSKKLIDSYDSLSSSRIKKLLPRNGKVIWVKDSYSEVIKLRLIFDEFANPTLDEPLRSFLVEKFQSIIYSERLSDLDTQHYTYLFEKLIEFTEYDDTEVLNTVVSSLSWYSSFKIFTKFKTILPKAYSDFVDNDTRFKIKLDEVFKREIRSAEPGNVDYTISDIEFIQNECKIDLSQRKEEFERIKEEAEKGETPVDWDDKGTTSDKDDELNEDAQIIDLFASFFES